MRLPSNVADGLTLAASVTSGRTSMNEALLEMEERHIAQLERKIARQETILEDLQRDRLQRTAETARTLLTTLQTSLRLAREHAERLKRQQ